MSGIREDVAVVRDDAHTNFVGRAFYAQNKHATSSLYAIIGIMCGQICTTGAR